MELPKFFMIEKIQDKSIIESTFPNLLYILLEDIQTGIDYTITSGLPCIKFKTTLTNKHIIYSPGAYKTYRLKDSSATISGREYFWINYPLICADNPPTLNFITTDPKRIDKYLTQINKLVMIDTL